MKKLWLALALAALTAGLIPAPASASNTAIVIPFEKHWVGEGHYVGTTDNGDTIEMFIYNSSFKGNVQRFTATVLLDLPEGSLRAILKGRFDGNTLEAVLNGRVVEGWLEGARVHEESQLVGFDPLTFVGMVQLMPGSAD